MQRHGLLETVRAVDRERVARRLGRLNGPWPVLAEVEALEPRDLFLAAGGDVVEIVLHGGREPVVDQVREVVLQQPDNGEGREGRDERRPSLPHIAPVLDGPDDAGISRRTSDAELLETPNERSLGVARRRLGCVLLDLEAVAIDVSSGDEPRQADVLVAPTLTPAVAVLVVVLPVNRQEAGIGDDRARRHEHRDGSAARDWRLGQGAPDDASSCGRPGRIVHLRCDRPLPDELVKAALLTSQLAGNLGGRPEAIAGGPDRFVSLLRVLHLAAVHPGRARHGLGAIECLSLVSGGPDGGIRQRRRVGPHVGDVTPLVEPLRDLHGPLCGEPQLARGFLLERGGDEGGGRRSPVRALLDASDFELGAGEGRDEATSSWLVEQHDLVG